MIRWHTVNKGENVPDRDPAEVQIERLLEAYQKTLRLHQKGKLDEAKQRYEEIATNKLVKGGKKIDESNNLPSKSSPISLLRFLVFKNYASILNDEFLATNESDMTVGKQSMHYYLEAISVDPTDHALWYRVGKLARALKNYRFARYAFESGFYGDTATRSKATPVNHVVVSQVADSKRDINYTLRCGNLTPLQWKCMECLCDVLLDIGDHSICRFYLDNALRHYPAWSVGSRLLERMKDEPILDEDTPMMANETSTAINSTEITLTKPQWQELAKALLGQLESISKKGVDAKNSLFQGRIVNIILTQQESPIPALLDAPSADFDRRQETRLEVESERMIELPDDKNETARVNTELDHDVTMLDADHAPVVSSDSTSDIALARTADDAPEVQPTPADQSSQNSGNDVGKRKREEGGEEEEEDESEPEEKRATLRASKRQQEKIESEETSRRKMLEEEQDLNLKLQAVFDETGTMSSLKRGTPWYSPVHTANNPSSFDLFWKYFDTKVSELDKSYCWRYGDQRSKNETRFSSSSRRCAQFEVADNISTQHPPTLNDETVLSFVETINQNNSGLTDILCKIVFAILEHGRCSVDRELSTVLVDVVTAVNDNLMNQLLYDASSHSSTGNDWRLLFTLELCEHVMDKLIRAVQANERCSTQQVSLRKKSATTASRQTSQAVAECKELCTAWIGFFERLMFPDTTGTTGQSSRAVSNEKIEQLLRYWFLKGKMAQCEDNVGDAFELYKRCRDLLQHPDYAEISISLNCHFDNIISASTVGKKLEFLEMGKHALVARDHYAKKDYASVISLLEPVVDAKIHADTLTTSGELFDVLNMLSRSYIETNEKLKAWNCYSIMLCRLVSDLISHGCMQMSDMILRRDEDTEFLGLLDHIDTFVSELVLLCSEDKIDGWLPVSVEPGFSDALAVLLQMSVLYTFKHPDFIPLANNFQHPDAPPYVPSRETISSTFNALIVKTWVLESTLIQHYTKDYPSQVSSMLPTLSNLLVSMHAEFGERDICSSAKGVFLRHMIKLLIKVDKGENRRDLYQCYHCLYEVHIAPESDEIEIEEHNASHEKITMDAIEPLFLLLADSIIDKLRHNAPLKSDMKDTVDEVTKLFNKLPSSNSSVEYNQKVVESYLNGDIRLYESINSMLGSCGIITHPLNTTDPPISSVFFKIFWIEGKMCRLQIKSRSKNPERTIPLLEDAVEHFMNHVTLTPDDADGWCNLGTCLMQLAEEELVCCATNNVEHSESIAKYHRSAFHSFMRAWYLYKTASAKMDHHALHEYFSNFGHLIYSMTCPPMSMEAFKIQHGDRAMDKDGKIYEISRPQPLPSFTYRLALVMFTRALEYKSSDYSDWKSLYMSGKCFSKLSRPPHEVLDWYRKAIRFLSTRSDKPGHREMAVEPIYRLCSTLAKYLHQGKINAQTVYEYLAVEPPLQREMTDEPFGPTMQSPVQPNASHSEQLPWTDVIVVSDDEEAQSARRLPPDQAAAFQTIYNKLDDIRKGDKDDWYHRPVFRQAWIQYHVYHNAEKAKAEILPLFTLRSAKSHIKIWKPDFERPGKHFSYVHEYTMFLIELAKVTHDADCLKNLCRKLRKAQDVLLHEKKAFVAALNAYAEVIRSQLITEQDKYNQVLDVLVDKAQFETLCATFRKTTEEAKTQPKPKLIQQMQDLFEMKKLNQQQLGSDNDMDALIKVCFAAILWSNAEFPAIVHPKTVTTATAMEEDSDDKAKTQLQLTDDVLLAQAKTLVL